jgi:hypothetical protein
MQLHHTPDGDPYYTQLPPGWKVATLRDFYNHDHLIINKPYLVHSDIDPQKYWGKRTKIDFPYPGSDFGLFLQKGMVFVKDG